MLNFDGYGVKARKAALVAVLAASLGVTPTAMAQGEAEALDHAQTIEAAWQRLEDHIRLRSAAAVSWPGATPPASTGWQADWTSRGLGALYCGQVLVVFANRADLKGVGDDQRAIRLAPHIEAARTHDEVPPLHWLEAGEAQGILGRTSVTLPACMAGAAPSGRVALAGEVVDPFTVSNQVLTPERQDRACPAGTHGDGQVWVRDIAQEVNGRGDSVGSPVPGPWRLLVDHCVADYTEWVHYRTACTFTPGPPHSGTLTGESVWRRQRSVTSSGETWLTAPQFVSTSCWTDPNPTPPSPTDWQTTTTETRTVACGTGYTGTRTQRRTHTWLNRKWPWDASPTTRLTATTAWTTTATSCRQIPPPDDPPDHDPPDDDPDQDDPPDDSTTETTTQTTTRQCVDRDKGGGNCGDGGNGGNGGRDGTIGGGWDVDGDGKADVEHSGDLTESQRQTANYVDGHTPIGRDRGGPDNDGGDPGSNCGGCGREGF